MGRFTAGSLGGFLTMIGFKSHQHVGLSQKRDGGMASRRFPCTEEGLVAGATWLNERPDADTYYQINPIRPLSRPEVDWDDESSEGLHRIRDACAANSTTEKASNGDVTDPGRLLIDIDPEKLPDGSTTDARRNEARALARDLFEDLTLEKPYRVLWVDSGRGQQLILKTELEPLGRKRLLRWIKSSRDTALVKVDNTADVARLARLPGSINSRTGNEVYVSLGENTWGPGSTYVDFDADGELSALPRRTFGPDDLASRIPLTLDPEEPEAPTFGHWDRTPPSEEEIRRHVRGNADRGLLALWEDSAAGDRSNRDARFLGELLRARVPDEVAQRLVSHLPGGKVQDRLHEESQSYLVSLWKTAHKIARKDLRDRQRRAKLLALLDSNEPLDALQGLLASESGLSALADLSRDDPVGYGAAREKIKARALWPGGVSALDAAVKERRARQRAANATAPDHVLVVVSDGRSASWKVRRTGEGAWIPCATETEAKRALRAEGLDPDSALGAAERFPWCADSVPFEPKRKLPGRRWNVSEARLHFPNPQAGPYSSWIAMTDHLGQGLDGAVRDHPWLKKVCILSGGDYVRVWVATMLTDPASRRPLLYLFSQQQGTGKTTMLDALKDFVLDGGSCDIGPSLSEKFNGALAGAVLGFVSETDSTARTGHGGGRKQAYNKIKSLVTDSSITIRSMGRDTYLVPNTISLFMATNSAAYCPMDAGDTRVTMIEVFPLKGGSEGASFKNKLRREAEAFTAGMFKLAKDFKRAMTTLERSGGGEGERLVLPALSTDAKDRLMDAALGWDKRWLRDHPEHLLMDEKEIGRALEIEAASIPGARVVDAKHLPRLILDASPEHHKAAKLLQVLKRRGGEWTKSGELAEAAGLPGVTSGKIMRRLLGLGDVRLQHRSGSGRQNFYRWPEVA